MDTFAGPAGSWVLPSVLAWALGALLVGVGVLTATLRLRAYEVAYLTAFTLEPDPLLPAALRRPEQMAAALMTAQWLGWTLALVLLSWGLRSLSQFLPFDSAMPGLWWLLPLIGVGMLALDARAARLGQQQPTKALRLGQLWLRLLSPLLALPAWLIGLAYARLLAAPSASQRAAELHDLAQTIDDTPEEDSPVEEKALLKSLITLNQKPVKAIMCPRAQMRSLSTGDTQAQVLTKIREFGYSRYPVLDPSGLTVRGVLVVKDLLSMVSAAGTSATRVAPFDWRRLLRAPYYVPEVRRVPQLLNEFKQRRLHLALVLDENGQVQGLVTLQDILDEIFGEMRDEFDAPAPEKATRLSATGN